MMLGKDAPFPTHHEETLMHSPRIVNGIAFSPDTDPGVVLALIQALSTGHRVRIRYGDTKTGRDDATEHMVEGTVSTSPGRTSKILILVHNTRSRGGGAIPTGHIVRIIDLKTKHAIYSHPKYHHPEWRIEKAISPGYESAVYDGTTLIAQFTSRQKADQWVKKMSL